MKNCWAFVVIRMLSMLVYQTELNKVYRGSWLHGWNKIVEGASCQTWSVQDLLSRERGKLRFVSLLKTNYLWYRTARNKQWHPPSSGGSGTYVQHSSLCFNTATRRQYQSYRTQQKGYCWFDLIGGSFIQTDMIRIISFK